MKNKKLHDIMKHSNDVTKKLIEINSLDILKRLLRLIRLLTYLFQLKVMKSYCNY